MLLGAAPPVLENCLFTEKCRDRGDFQDDDTLIKNGTPDLDLESIDGPPAPPLSAAEVQNRLRPLCSLIK